MNERIEGTLDEFDSSHSRSKKTKSLRRSAPTRVFLAVLVVAAFMASIFAALAFSAPIQAQICQCEQAVGFNTPGNVLITDQFNNRIIEVNQTTKQIVWSYGSGNPSDCNATPGHILGSNWAERLAGGLTVMAGTGTPNCSDNRVIVVNQAGEIVWQYGQGGLNGTGPNLLNVPVAVIQLPNSDFLITDQGNNRIIEVNQTTKQIVWSYGPASGPGALNSPNSAELLENGDFLIADEGNNRVIEISPAGSIVWQYCDGINAAAFASRLPNGNTLITDSGNARILEVTPSMQVVFQYFTNTSADSNPNPLPTNAVRLANGNTIIADQFNDRVFIIDPSKQIVWQYGMTNVIGNSSGLLNGPYTGFVIGDYTGQTVPPGIMNSSAMMSSSTMMNSSSMNGSQMM